ncbi:hypothetical protein EPUS_05749 [Endocarpon pusillum Z07020]|uniref:RlpA-like protein double-psi beta-barrel domain-containing protein n=1 Tax=Endocarpon pusillum (strain Z07020 / HMAS-L-300199) TaxID=1263415 RepID=U1G9L9_ENDPU|nr:uncharacterized protein EPUS_05749 [Endocarpon pusillum Z07020]ERF68688.1 hypothetical protein EPUS_05749 [Endocarpon pusillum Z07020]
MKSTLIFSLVTLLSTTSLAQKFTGGRATFYSPSVGLGSCGETHADSDLVVAGPSSMMPGACGKTVMITNTGTGNGAGNTISAEVVDTCAGCGESDLDLSIGAFDQLTNGDLAAGVATIDSYGSINERISGSTVKS